MDRIRVGLIGTGFGRHVQMPGFLAVPEFEVVGICSETKAHAEAAARTFGVADATDDYRALVERDDVDVVSIATPPHLHCSMTLAALDAGKHVLCEKPMALNVAEARAMLDAARSAQRIHAIDHLQRYMPAHQQFRKLVQEGFIGRLRYLVVNVNTGLGLEPTMPWYFHSWRSEKPKGGGMLSGVLSHYIDLVRWCFGEIENVRGHTATLIDQKPVLSSDYMEGELQSGGLFTLAGSWSLHQASGARLEAYGDEGTLVLGSRSSLQGARRSDKGLREIKPEFVLPEGIQGHVSAFAAQLTELKGTLRGDSAGTCYATFEDGLRVQQVIDAVRADRPENWTRLATD
jgi:predicted dehydrogenase